MLGAHSDTLLLAHLIWATSNRRATLVRDFDGWFTDFAAAACRRIGCDLLAVGNASDHVHAVVRLSSSAALAEVVRRLKGGSSHAWNVRECGTPLHWQTGYWARSIDQEALAMLTAYVREQRVRHATATTLAAWEQHEATWPDRSHAQ
jgi:putative transposase